MAQFVVEPLTDAHDRASFTCGTEALDRYFHQQINQDIRRNLAKCFVGIEIASGNVAGYFTLTSTGLVVGALPDAITRKLPRYPVVPAALIGRLAVASNYQGKGLGASLIADAIQRIDASFLGVFAIVVDAKNDAARAFYERHSFEQLPGHAARLFLSLATAKTLIGR